MFDSAYQIPFKCKVIVEGKNLATGLRAAIVATLHSAVIF